MSSIISKLVIKDNHVRILVEDEETVSTYKIRLSDYLDNHYYSNQILDEEDLKVLSELHYYCYGYYKCLRKLSNGDYSEKEIRQLLKKVRELSQTNTNKMIDELKSLGFLKDENVVNSQLYTDHNRLIGKKKTLYHLTNRGVDREVAKEIVGQVDEKEELERGIKKAEILLKRIKGKSFKETQFLLRNKLIEEGFENINEIIDSLDLQLNQDSEMDSLEKMYEKAFNRYSKKYSGNKLSDACCKYLLSKGYSMDMIKQVMKLKGENEYEN